MNDEDKKYDINMLRMLVKQANSFGAKLRVYKPKSGKYEYCITGSTPKHHRIRMGGTAFWLYDELMKSFCNGV